jgi:hypothetical protein
VPAIVFARTTTPQLETEAPGEWVTVYPRPIDLENSERLGRFPLVQVVASFEAPRTAPSSGCAARSGYG